MLTPRTLRPTTNPIGGDEEALEADVANLLKKRARRESSRNTVGYDPGPWPGPWSTALIAWIGPHLTRSLLHRLVCFLFTYFVACISFEVPAAEELDGMTGDNLEGADLFDKDEFLREKEEAFKKIYKEAEEKAQREYEKALADAVEKAKDEMAAEFYEQMSDANVEFGPPQPRKRRKRKATKKKRSKKNQKKRRKKKQKKQKKQKKKKSKEPCPPGEDYCWEHTLADGPNHYEAFVADLAAAHGMRGSGAAYSLDPRCGAAAAGLHDAEAGARRAALVEAYIGRANSTAGHAAAADGRFAVALLSERPRVWRVRGFASGAEADYLREAYAPHLFSCGDEICQVAGHVGQDDQDGGAAAAGDGRDGARVQAVKAAIESHGGAMTAAELAASPSFKGMGAADARRFVAWHDVAPKDGKLSLAEFKASFSAPPRPRMLDDDDDDAAAALLRFYREHAPERATVAAVDKVLAKYEGAERRELLYRRLKTKYGEGPQALLWSAGAVVDASDMPPDATGGRECDEIQAPFTHADLEQHTVLRAIVARLGAVAGHHCARADCFPRDVDSVTNTLGTNVQLVRYKAGGHFQPHHDVGGRDGNEPMPLTMMLFLNDVGADAGGQTEFPKANGGNGLLVAPAKGDLLIWSTCDAKGKLDDSTLHQGLPLTRGEKWILNWFLDTQSIDLDECKALEPRFKAGKYFL